MEETMTFEELAKKEGGTVTPCEFSEEFLREFQEYMEESIRQSIINQAKSIESASKIIIYLNMEVRSCLTCTNFSTCNLLGIF